MKIDHAPFVVPPGKKIHLANYDPAYTGEVEGKEDSRARLEEYTKELRDLQDVLYAHDKYGILLIFQAMDASGKDSAVKHVLSGVNPAGFQVYSFKAPSEIELDHDYMWRCMRTLPERGRIGIFNRSYYEEVLVARVQPSILQNQKLPTRLKNNEIWKQRYEDINNLERYLTNNAIVVIKFFLYVSKEKQKKRFLKRIERPDKNWKFSPQDLKQREKWDEYMQAYEQMLSHTSTEWAPWYVIPADHKWFTRVALADIIVSRLNELNLHYPDITDEQRTRLMEAKEILENES